jgi:hypothetical protein
MGIRPQMAADIGGKPKPIKADGNEFEPGTARHQPEKFTAVA